MLRETPTAWRRVCRQRCRLERSIPWPRQRLPAHRGEREAQQTHLRTEKACFRPVLGPPELADPRFFSRWPHSYYTPSVLFLHESPPARAKLKTSPCSLTCLKAGKQGSLLVRPKQHSTHIQVRKPTELTNQPSNADDQARAGWRPWDREPSEWAPQPPSCYPDRAARLSTAWAQAASQSLCWGGGAAGPRRPNTREKVQPSGLELPRSREDMSVRSYVRRGRRVGREQGGAPQPPHGWHQGGRLCGRAELCRARQWVASLASTHWRLQARSVVTTKSVSWGKVRAESHWVAKNNSQSSHRAEVLRAP